VTNVIVILKSGEELCAPIWMWRPKEGWFSLVGDPDRRIKLDECVSAVEKGVMTHPGVFEDVDLLEKAREE
jgi:hypothetical protein